MFFDPVAQKFDVVFFERIEVDHFRIAAVFNKVALFVEDDLPALSAILPEHLTGGPIPNAGQYLYGIAQDLLRLQVGENGTAPVRWSATYLPYTIDPS